MGQKIPIRFQTERLLFQIEAHCFNFSTMIYGPAVVKRTAHTVQSVALVTIGFYVKWLQTK